MTVLCGRGGVRPSSGETVPFHRDFTSKPFRLVFILVFDYANANTDFHIVRFSPILADILSNRLILKQTAKLYVAQKWHRVRRNKTSTYPPADVRCGRGLKRLFAMEVLRQVSRCLWKCRLCTVICNWQGEGAIPPGWRSPKPACRDQVAPLKANKGT